MDPGTLVTVEVIYVSKADDGSTLALQTHIVNKLPRPEDVVFFSTLKAWFAQPPRNSELYKMIFRA